MYRCYINIQRLSMPQKLDLNELVANENVENSDSKAPSIKVSLPNVPQENELTSYDNPVFTLDESQNFLPKPQLPDNQHSNVDNHISSNGSIHHDPVNNINTQSESRSNSTLFNNEKNINEKRSKTPAIVDNLKVPSSQDALNRSNKERNKAPKDRTRGTLVPAISIESVSPPSTPYRSNSVLSQLSKRQPSISESIYSLTESSPLWADKNSHVYTQLKKFATSINNRAKLIKDKVRSQPPSPEPSPPPSKTATPVPEKRNRLDSFAATESSRANSTLPNGLLKHYRYLGFGKYKFRFPPKLPKINYPKTFDKTSWWYISWLFIVTMCYLYNSYVIFLRYFFSVYQTSENLYIWYIFDYVSDFVYLLDIVIFKPRVRCIEHGLLIEDPVQTRQYYFRQTEFKIDVISLLPFDILYVICGTNTLLRLPRILKISSFWDFFDGVEKNAKAPHIPRVIRTINYMFFLIHVNACAYYAFSAYEKFSTTWSYNNKGSPYLRCFYIAFKIATSVGNIQFPTNANERLFMNINWLLGIFVFALLIGQIRDILSTAGSAKKEAYRKVVDDTIFYLQTQKIPQKILDKVKVWFVYQWDQAKSVNENAALEFLPKKIRTDIAINVHYHILNKVQLFQDCDKNLLRDLVLKLRPVLFLPGDLVCTKGEVGKEMYIVNNGAVQVVGGENDEIVFATLGEGSVFGEISLLSMAGGNRRTANVKSVGFSNLFILSKADLHETIQDYPEAKEILRKKAEKMINENAARVKKSSVISEVTIKSREGTPKLIKTIMQVVNPKTARLLSARLRAESKMEITEGKESRPPSAISKDIIEVPGDNGQENELLIVETSETILKEGEEAQNKITVINGNNEAKIVKLNQNSNNQRPFSADSQKSLISLAQETFVESRPDSSSSKKSKKKDSQDQRPFSSNSKHSLQSLNKADYNKRPTSSKSMTSQSTQSGKKLNRKSQSQDSKRSLGNKSVDFDLEELNISYENLKSTPRSPK